MKAYNIWRIKLLNKYCFFSDMDYTQYRNVSSGTWAAMRKNTANKVQVMKMHDEDIFHIILGLKESNKFKQK